MKKYLKVIVFGVLSFVIVGCVSKVAPIGDRGFKHIQNIKELNGCYLNLGTSGDKGKSDLSYFLWGDKINEHKKIKSICVSSVNENTISIIGRGIKNKKIYVQNYIKNKDFKIESGKIIVKSKLGIVNDNIVGPTYESVIIGLDKEGDGRVASSNSFAGIALLIPIVAYESKVYKFLRVKSYQINN